MSASGEERKNEDNEDVSRENEKGTKGYQRRAVINNVLAIVQAGLSFANAIKEDGFQFASFREFIFAASAVIEFVGLFFALYLAHQAYTSGHYDVGEGGAPLVMVRKAAKTWNNDLMRTAVFNGLGAQACGFWVLFLVYVLVSDIAPALPISLWTFSTVGMWRILVYNQEQHAVADVPRPSRADAPSLYALGHLILSILAFLAPVAVEIFESVFLLSESDSPESILLGLLDLVYILIALKFILFFFREIMPAMWESALAYNPSGTRQAGS